MWQAECSLALRLTQVASSSRCLELDYISTIYCSIQFYIVSCRIDFDPILSQLLRKVAQRIFHPFILFFHLPLISLLFDEGPQ